MTFKAALFILLSVPCAWAEDCPASKDISLQMTQLIKEANAAQNQSDGFVVTDQMWKLWTTAPDARSQELLDIGMERREVMDFTGAIKAFDALVKYCPDYAEGYNQRAFVNFLLHNFDTALTDLNIALQLSPDHVAAESGKALTLIGLGRREEAYIALKSAVRKNPWMQERALLESLIDEKL